MTTIRQQPDDPHLAPDMVGFRLLKLTNLLSRPFFRQFAKEHSLTLNEWRCIVVIADRPGVVAQEIAAATGMLPMNVSRAVAGLRSADRIYSERDPDNHRRALLWLTDAGRQTFDAIAPHAERDASWLFQSLTPEQLRTFSELVDLLLARAEAIVGG